MFSYVLHNQEGPNQFQKNFWILSAKLARIGNTFSDLSPTPLLNVFSAGEEEGRAWDICRRRQTVEAILRHKEKGMRRERAWNGNLGISTVGQKSESRLCDLATAPAGGITQTRTHFFGQLCNSLARYFGFLPSLPENLEQMTMSPPKDSYLSKHITF